MISSRIKELRHVAASSLVANPKNWRKHPPLQINALRAALDKIGFADVLITRETDSGKLMLIDGHLRTEVVESDDLVPVVVTDLSEDESDFLLATLDPLAAMARADGDLLKELADSLDLENEALKRMLDAELKSAGVRTLTPSSNARLYTDQRIIDAAFEYFRARGFPYRKQALHTSMHELNELATMHDERLIETTIGYQIADTYHPHRFHASAQGMASPFESFQDDKKLRHALELQMQYVGTIGEDYLTYFSLVHGTQTCANFRPGFACAIYKQFCRDEATVLDTSTGYGGRLLGFIASGCAGRYIGFDPCSATHAGNELMALDLGFGNHVDLFKMPIEDAAVATFADRCDFAFTSPPYFSKEHYSNESTQSYLRYPTTDEWREGFLDPMMRFQFTSLRAGCYSAVNIADVKIDGVLLPLTEWLIKAAAQAGFNYVRTDEYVSFRKFGNGPHAQDTEPIFIFRKP